MKPIAPATGIALAFPDVCLTQVGPSQVPIPYPNIAQLDQATGISNASGKELLVGPSSLPVLLMDSTVSTTTGDEAGTAGVVSGTTKSECKVVQASTTVLYGSSSKGIARFMDATTQNKANAQGMILSAFPTVLVGD